MTASEYKSAIAIELAQTSVNLLINELAKAKEEIDSLKTEIAKLKASPAPAVEVAAV
jgi:hypothetical protein